MCQFVIWTTEWKRSRREPQNLWSASDGISHWRKICATLQYSCRVWKCIATILRTKKCLLASHSVKVSHFYMITCYNVIITLCMWFFKNITHHIKHKDRVWGVRWFQFAEHHQWNQHQQTNFEEDFQLHGLNRKKSLSDKKKLRYHALICWWGN